MAQQKTDLGSTYCGTLGFFCGSYDIACLTLQKSTVAICSLLAQISCWSSKSICAVASARVCLRRETVQSCHLYAVGLGFVGAQIFLRH